MKDMETHLEKLRRDAAECAIIRDLATDPKKRELFTKLAEHMSVLASQIERAIAEQTDKADSVGAPQVTRRQIRNDEELR